MKVLEDLVAPAVMSDLVSRLISFLIERYGKRRTSSCSWVEPASRLELLALKIHAVVDEAEQRHMGNKRSLLLWLQKLMDGMYRAYFAVDSARHRQDDDDGLLVRPRPMKRRRTVSAGAGDDDDGRGRVVVQLSLVLASLESATADLKDFVQLLACCPTIPRATNFRSDGNKCMFGRLVERERIIGFLTRPDAGLGILPVVGGPEVGKGTIVKHVCDDPRVRRHFDVILYSYGSLLAASSRCIHDDVLGAFRSGGHLLHEAPVSGSGRRRHLLVIKNTYQVDIDEEAWVAVCASLGTANGSRIIVVSENDRVAELGTVEPLRVKPLRREEYWYFFRSLALGPVPEDEEHYPPGLAVLGRQIAAALHGSFFGAKVLGGLLRSNLDERFWRSMLGVVRRFQAAMLLRGGVERQHFYKLGIARMVIKVLPTPLKLKCASQSCGPSDEFFPPAVDVQHLLRAGRVVPAGGESETAEMRVVLWESACPPNYRYTVVCETVRMSA